MLQTGLFDVYLNGKGILKNGTSVIVYTAVGSVKDHWLNQFVWGALRVLVIVSLKRQLSDGRCLVTLMQ